MSKTFKITLGVIAGLLILGTVFILGRNSVQINEKIITKYIELDPVHDTIDNPVPYEVKVPIEIDTANFLSYCIRSGLYDYLIPTIVEEKIIYEKVDTAKIVNDFVSEVLYNIVLFDIDTIGKTQLHAKVQYNRLSQLSYDFYPIQKQTTMSYDYTRKFEPFVSAGMGLDNSVRAGVGAFFRSGLGIEGAYRRNFETNKNTAELNILFKF